MRTARVGGLGAQGEGPALPGRVREPLEPEAPGCVGTLHSVRALPADGLDRVRPPDQKGRVRNRLPGEVDDTSLDPAAARVDGRASGILRVGGVLVAGACSRAVGGRLAGPRRIRALGAFLLRGELRSVGRGRGGQARRIRRAVADEDRHGRAQREKGDAEDQDRVGSGARAVGRLRADRGL